jgi:predicted RNA-binding Zn ribbon-like protein
METTDARRHEDIATPAPGELELVRSFLSLHDHAPGGSDATPPAAPTIVDWLRRHELIGARTPGEADVAWVVAVRDALRAQVFETMGAPRDAKAARVLDDAARRTGLRPAFDDPERPIRSDAAGIRGAVGRLLCAAFLARLDGSWHRLRECADPTCTSVFYDRSRNHSTKWCTMATCGNRNKVRTFRKRRSTRRVEGADA